MHMSADDPPESLIRVTLGSESATILDWRAEPIAYVAYLPGRSLVRFTGRAWVDGREVPWSLVRKRMSSGDPGAREALAYRAVLGELRGELRAPRALVTADEGGATLWLEDVKDAYDHQWSLAEYARAARALGSFNGAYLIPGAIPAVSWLARDWIDNHSEPGKIGQALEEVQAFATSPVVRQVFPEAGDARGLLEDQPRWAAVLAQLPPTLCHHDASKANLVLRRDRAGGLETVAVDWEAIGHGVPGADLATFVVGTMRRGEFPAERAAELDQVAFDAYVEGLHGSGARGELPRVRLGYAAAVSLRWSIVAQTLRALAEPRLVPQMIALSRFVLDRAALARRLAPA